ncbi:hypothetical protein F4774DRAFT_388204 [Daldinia eschscholtzii]|nr:hypothetical protein F4774DRAFT_388204 [Daldinia eschscholtzii]
MSFDSFDPNTTPIMMPPPGVIPNFKDPDSISYITRNVTYAFLPLMLAFVVLRLCTRVLIRHSSGLDDVLYVASAASVVTVCGMALSALDRPNGRHAWDVPLSILTDSYLRTNFVFVIISSITTMLVKLTLLVLYLRIFNPVEIAKIAIYICIGVTISFYIATMIAELVVGLPKAGGEGWQAAQIRYGPFGLNLSVVRGVFGVISDFVILLIPMTQVIKLHLPLRKKITILGIFLTGLLACACSIVTCVFRFLERYDLDYTWANTMPNTFAIIELTVGHICCSLPTLPPLIGFLNNNETLLSIIRYLKSDKSRKNSNEDPMSLPSSNSKNQLPRIPQGRLTGMRSFIQKARLTSFSKKATFDGSYGQSNYHDLESIDLDYHAQLKNNHTPTSSQLV